MSTARTGGQILVDQLIVHGAERVFGVAGESFLPLLDGLYERADRLRYIGCRQEGGAAIMAEADGKLTGRPGVCVVTRGPGATNASAGVHIARQDSTPLILLVGQVPRPMLGREAFQEIDLPAMFGPVCKWAAQIDAPAQLPEMLARAFTVATSDRPGPVVLALPEDMLAERASVDDAEPYSASRAVPTDADLEAFGRALSGVSRPLVIVGGSGWDAEACAELRRFAEAARLPVAASFRRQHCFDNTSPSYAGELGLGLNPRLAQRVREADLLIALGARLGEIPTAGYTLLEAPKPRQRLIHVHADREELGRVYEADLPIHADPRAMGRALAELPPVDGSAWASRTEEINGDYRGWSEPTRTPGALQLGEVVKYLRDTLPADAIVTNGAGNYTVWVHRFYRYRQIGTQLAPIAGSMGYGVPAAIAAKLRYPERTVVAFAGDGCFLMNGQELATAVQHGAAIVCIVVNNGMLGTIRMHQERHFPARVIGTDLVNPDFAALARAFGAHGEVVERTADFAEAFARATRCGKPALLELRVDPEALTPARSLAEIRESASGTA